MSDCRTTRVLAALAAALAVAACQSGAPSSSGPAAAPAAPVASLALAFADPAWTGDTVPAGQQCRMFGGAGATPAISVSGIPAGTTDVIVEFNDRGYRPLSSDGGHGKIGYRLPADTTTIVLQSVPGETADVPAPAYVERRNRATGSFARPGYLPPCSGGRGNPYFAVVKAVDKAAGGAVLAQGTIELGRY